MALPSNANACMRRNVNVNVNVPFVRPTSIFHFQGLDPPDYQTICLSATFRLARQGCLQWSGAPVCCIFVSSQSLTHDNVAIAVALGNRLRRDLRLVEAWIAS
jgi:hypothetical protein